MLYDWFEYHIKFSVDVFDAHNYHGYTYLGLIMVLSSITVMSVFYYAWNPTYGRWYHWLIMLIVSAIIAAVIAYAYLNDVLIQFTDNTEYPDTESFILNMVLVTFLYTFILSMISSFIIRIGSSKNKANPFALRIN